MVIVLFLLFGIFTGVTGYYLGYNKLVPRFALVPASQQPATQTPVRVGGAQATPPATTATPSATPIPTPQVDPKTTVDTFMKNFIAAAPPKNDKTASQTVKNLLSQNEQQTLQSKNASSVSSGIAKMVNVVSVPDSYTVGNTTMQDSTAIVPTTWSFLNGGVKKVFYLVDENNVWKIDAIQDQ
ncbi:MAG TPA: hypothetical protein VN711_05045 [Candidatus Saccharimonadales bacterium]|nr:hypothetical protein [Candidatus Saccharimonadales bacterium]